MATPAYKIDAGRLPAVLDDLARHRQVITRMDRDGVNVFARYTGDMPSLRGNGAVSAREHFLPRMEKIHGYQLAPGEVRLSPAGPVEPAVLFGARPCDLAALELLDRVLLEGEFLDTAYQARRAATVNMALACDSAGPGCFCRSVGVSPAGTAGSDVILYPSGQALLAVATTARGAELLESLGLPGAAKDEVDRAQDACEQLVVPVAVETGPVTARLGQRLDDPYWAEASRRCLGCGICTYICPTCYCFAVHDINRGSQGARVRCWDSCMFKDFLTMAGGHNPRPTRKERFRQRFLHKLQYYPEQYGSPLCVGCGRCLDKCPAGLDMAGVIMDLGGGQ
ncbi:MAG: 4Fe-4S dicluster domain-containing protein [Bacillota bacterium]